MAQVKIIKSRGSQIEKADHITNIGNGQENTTEWITPFYSQRGLQRMVSESTILPQCITAYKTNIAGFGIVLEYNEDYKEETPEMKAEWDKAQTVLDLLAMDKSLKSVFEDIIACRETNGIAYCEVLRSVDKMVTQIDYIKNPETITKTIALEPLVEYERHYKGNAIKAKKRFCKYRQQKNGKTIYFKEVGDPRIMDKNTGEYCGTLDFKEQANEIIEFPIGTHEYGAVHWEGQILSAQGSRLAENLNYKYFTNGRHTPLAIILKNGTLSDESFTKLQGYMDAIAGEKGQHAFLVLEAESNEDGTAFDAEKSVDIELKDLSPMLQNDALFQSYLDDNRKKIQSAYRLPDLYVGYTADYNRATAQTAIEITEQQVFIPEREELGWVINNKLLDCYNFKYVRAVFKSPKIVNYEDLAKVLAVVKAGGGATPNDLKGILYDALGKPYEDFTEDWGNVPIDIYTKANAQQVQNNLAESVSGVIKLAESNNDNDIVPVLKEIRKMLIEKQQKDLIRTGKNSIMNYSPDQERDDHGRWTDGGGFGGGSDSSSSGGNSGTEQSTGTYSHPTLNLPKKEYGKVVHEINTVYHARFKGQSKGKITSGKYRYRFEISEFNEYNIYYKEKVK